VEETEGVKDIKSSGQGWPDSSPATWLIQCANSFNAPTHSRRDMTQPIAFGVSFLHSQISIDHLVLDVSFTTFRWKETKDFEIGDWDYMILQMQQVVFIQIHHSIREIWNWGLASERVQSLLLNEVYVWISYMIFIHMHHSKKW